MPWRAGDRHERPRATSSHHVTFCGWSAHPRPSRLPRKPSPSPSRCSAQRRHRPARPWCRHSLPWRRLPKRSRGRSRARARHSPTSRVASRQKPNRSRRPNRTIPTSCEAPSSPHRRVDPAHGRRRPGAVGQLCLRARSRKTGRQRLRRGAAPVQASARRIRQPERALLCRAMLARLGRSSRGVRRDAPNRARCRRARRVRAALCQDARSSRGRAGAARDQGGQDRGRRR